MADNPPVETVSMEALKDGSYGGVPFECGDTITVDPQYVEALTLMGLAARKDRAEIAAKARPPKPAKPAPPPPPAKAAKA